MFNKRIVLLSCLFAAVLALSACSTPRVRHDHDSRIDMRNYRTYVWEQSVDDFTAGGAAFSNPLNQKRLREAVEVNLAKQGLQPAAEGAVADCYVTVAIGTRQTLEADNRVPVRVGFGWGWWRPGMYGSMSWANDGLYTYREGRIAVDLFDAKTRQPIWHASVEQDLTSLTGNNAEARINTVVAAMFAKFPGVAVAGQ